MIEVESLSKRYGTHLAVDNVSFRVDPGEIVAFVGPNGAGKSTVLKVLSTYLEPDSGTARIKDVDVSKDPLAVRMNIGYMPEKSISYETMRVDAFLKFVGRARWLDGKKLNEQFDWVVENCALQSVLHKRVGQCSKGYQRRVSLAMTLIHDPDVILLDEPTHGLDPLQVMALRDFVVSLKPNRAILFSSHIFQEVVAICDRVLVINESHLLADGSINRLALDTGRKPVASCRFNGPAEEIKAALDSLASAEVRHVSEKEGSVISDLEMKNESMESDLRSLFTERGWELLSYEEHTLNLEEIFADILKQSMKGGA